MKASDLFVKCLENEGIEYIFGVPGEENADFMISLGYNFMLWLTATWVFYLSHTALKGGYIIKSLKIFGLMGLFFISLAAVYMNHYTEAVQPFYLYSMLDALILFPIVGVANGLLFPRFFKEEVHLSPGATSPSP